MKNKNLVLTVIISIIAFATIIYSAGSFYGAVNKELESSVRETLSDMADQQQISLNRQLESMVLDLSSINETLVYIGEDEEEILKYVAQKMEELNYETVILARANGYALVSNGQIVDVSNEEFFITAMSGKAFASDPYISEYSDKEVLLVATPVFKDGAIDGVSAVEYCTTYLDSLLTTFTDARGLNLVVDGDSNIMLSTNEFVLSFDAFKNAEFHDGTNFEEVVADFQNSESGSISYTLNGVKKYGEYRPIEINDWTLFFEISEETVSESVAIISARMIELSSVLVISAVFTLLYLMSSKNKAAKTLEKVALYDELTGLPNLIKFKMVVEETLNKYPDKNFAMVKMDTVNFKAINDLFGFEDGNRVIRAVADTSRIVRDELFIKARVSAEEFMMFGTVDHFNDLEDKSIAYEEEFKNSLPGFEEYKFKFRYGRYFINENEIDVNDIIHKTSIAHSFAKKDNSRNIWDYDESFRKKFLKETEIENKMHKALANKEFKAYLQPKYDIVSGKISGAEALVRWIEADGGTVYPSDFIPLFEQNRFIVELDKYMLRSVCEMLKSWKEQGKECLQTSVNFSRLHIRHPNFVKDIKEIVTSYGIETKYIEVELTESTVLENEQELKVLLKDLQKEGFLVSIDDFGSGYSSLGMLKNFKVDTLKLDRSFFIDLDGEEECDRGDLVVESVVKLAKDLGMYTVAEGIETIEQKLFLEKIKCDAAQGYLFAKPMPVADFEKLYFNQD